MNQPGFILLWFFAAILCRIQSLNWCRQGLTAIIVVCADQICTIGSVSSTLGCPCSSEQCLGAVLQIPKDFIAKTIVGLVFMLIALGCILGKTLGLSRHISLEYLNGLWIDAQSGVQATSMR